MAEYRYFNLNNGHTAERDDRHPRLEALDNWVRVDSDDHLADLQAEFNGTKTARGTLFGSGSVGDRSEPRHQVPLGTFEPKIEYTEPSKTQLPGQHPDPEAFHPEKQPEVVTLDPSQQVEPKTGPDKRDLSIQPPTDDQLDPNPNAKMSTGAGAPDGVLARAHPELEGVEERRQELIEGQREDRQEGDPDAGHKDPVPMDPDVNSTDGKSALPGPNTANRPARSAPKAEWVTWAVECGAERSDAEDMTKQDLIEIYGG